MMPQNAYPSSKGGHAFLTPAQQRARDEAVARERKALGVRRPSEWPFCSRQQLEQSNPSRRDGMSPEKEALWMRQMCMMLQKTGMQVRM